MKNADRADVLVLGRNCLDNLIVVDHYPVENRKAALIERHREGGGQGGTSAACIARLGGRVVLLGHVGDDEAGRFCRERLRAFGVPVAGVRMVAGGRTPQAFVIITRGSGKRTIVYEPSELPPIQPDERFWQLVGQADLLLLDPETTYLAHPLQRARLGRTQIVYDCERPRTHLDTMMATADYFVPSADYFRSEMAGSFNRQRLIRALFALKPRLNGHLIVTAGSWGAYFVATGAIWHVPAPRVTVVDTTGAGDNFHGALALALAKGMVLSRAVAFSVAVASLSCRGLGGREGLPQWDEAELLSSQLSPRLVYP